MTKIDNITNSLMTNPLVCVVIGLFVLLIILGIIRLLNPGFSIGAEIKGHFGSLNGGMRFEGFEGFEDRSMGQEDSSMGQEDSSMEQDTFTGSDEGMSEGMTEGMTESFNNQY